MSFDRLVVALALVSVAAGCDKKSDPTPSASAAEEKSDKKAEKGADKGAPAEKPAKAAPKKVDGPSADEGKDFLGLELPDMGGFKGKWDADAKVAKWENEDYEFSIVNRIVKDKLDDIEDLKAAAPMMMQLGTAITKVVEEKKTAKGWYAVVESESGVDLVYMRTFGVTVVCSGSLKKATLGKSLTKKEILDACESLKLK